MKLRSKLRKKDTLVFFQQLQVLSAAGLSLLRSLEILIQSCENPVLARLVRAILFDLKSGQQLSQALENRPLLLDRFSCLLLKIGEQTGELEKMLKQIIAYCEAKEAQKAKLKQALFYPALISITAFLTTLFMLLFVVPQFASLFASSPHQLPFMTRIVIRLADLLQHYGLNLLLFAALIFSGLYKLSSVKKCSRYFQAWIFRLPYISGFVKKTLLAKFAQNLACLLAAGIPLSESLKVLSSLSSSLQQSSLLLNLRTEINAGRQFHVALFIHAFFPPFFVQMVRTGEEAGRLESMLEKIAAVYDLELKHKLEFFNRIFEPLLIAMLGVLIGGLVIAMYLPIFQLGTVF